MVYRQTEQTLTALTGSVRAGSRILALAALLGAAACGSADAEARADKEARAAVGAAVTANLLENPVQDASPGAGERIDIATLGHNRGSESSPVQIIEFSDFGCGYCRKFHVETLPALMTDYVDQGKVIWKYVPFELGMFANGRASAVAGQCASEQGQFFAMGDLLFQRQGDWKNESAPRPVFVQLAGELGLDTAAFETCLDSPGALAVVNANSNVARQVGIRSTPTFFINGFPLQGALPDQVFRELIETVLLETAKQAEGQPGAP